MKKLIYICSPLRGDYEANIDNAISYSRAAFRLGYIPITPHIYFTRFLDDSNSKDRSMAMSAGFQLLLMCSEVWVFGLDNPSEGMQAEIALAVRHGIPIKDGTQMVVPKTSSRKKADNFVTLKEMFKSANVQLVPIGKEDGPLCQRIETTKAIKTLPRPKR